MLDAKWEAMQRMGGQAHSPPQEHDAIPARAYPVGQRAKKCPESVALAWAFQPS